MMKLVDYIAEYLSDTYIFEMARSLHDYKDKVESVIPALLAHIVLVKLENSSHTINKYYIKHWKHEIVEFFSLFYNMRLKTSNTTESKIRHCKDVIYDKMELMNTDAIIKAIASKLYAEGYDYDDEKTMKRITNIVDDIDLDEIIDVIASQDISKTLQYVKKL